MTVQEWEKDFYGNNVTITTRDNECVIYRIRDDSGDSVLTRFEVYPGIALIYNDVHTDYISIKELVGYENILEINHCREGRIEFESSEGECLYVKKGDMAINMKAGVKSYSYFPQSHYHGVTIEIDFDKIEKNQNMIMKEMQLSPKILQDKFCNHTSDCMASARHNAERILAPIFLLSPPGSREVPSARYFSSIRHLTNSSFWSLRCPYRAVQSRSRYSSSQASSSPICSFKICCRFAGSVS